MQRNVPVIRKIYAPATSKRRRGALVALFLAAGPLAGSSIAADRAWEACEKRQDLDLKVRGCSEILQRQHESIRKRAVAHNNRGIALDEKGDFDRALADFDEAIRLDRNLAGAYTNRGDVYASKGHLDRALEDHNRAISLDDKLAMAYNNRGIVYVRKGDTERAFVDFNQAIRLDEKLAIAYNNRGGVHAHKGDLDRAIADYDKAIHLNRSYYDAFYNRALAYQQKDYLARALFDFEAAARDPRNEDALRAAEQLRAEIARQQDARVPGAAAQKLAGPLQLPPYSAEAKDRLIGWHQNDLSAARARALREAKPLVVIQLGSDPKAAQDVARNVLPCSELNGLAGRAVFAAETSRPEAGLEIFLPRGSTLEPLRHINDLTSAVGIAASLSPVLGPVEPSGSSPDSGFSSRMMGYGGAVPSRCLPTDVATSILPPRWTPPLFPPTTPLSLPLTPDQLYERFRASVFIVRAYGGVSGDQPLALGSAVAATPTQLLTNCHVVANATRVTVTPTWGGSPQCPVVVTAEDVRGDRCWITLLPASTGPFFQLPEQERPAMQRRQQMCAAARSIVAGVRSVSSLRVGERVYAIGTPQGLSWTLTDSVVSALRANNGIPVVQTSTPIAPGSSGGALFDASGNLVGITSLGHGESGSLNLAIAAEAYWRP